jgi:hypothetical protein
MLYENDMFTVHGFVVNAKDDNSRSGGSYRIGGNKFVKQDDEQDFWGVFIKVNRL